MNEPITNYLAPNTTLSQAEATVPRFDWQDEHKRAYLSYRLCGFSRAESTKAAGITVRTVRNWLRDDQSFYEIEHRDLLELRKEFAKEIVGLDFSRNIKIAMDLDYRILLEANDDTLRPLMTKEDRDYLVKIRPLYTPQQMKILEEMFTDNTNDQGFDELILVARKTYASKNRDSEAQGSSDPAQRTEEEYSKGTDIEAWVTRGEEET